MNEKGVCLGEKTGWIIGEKKKDRERIHSKI